MLHLCRVPQNVQLIVFVISWVKQQPISIIVLKLMVINIKELLA